MVTIKCSPIQAGYKVAEKGADAGLHHTTTKGPCAQLILSASELVYGIKKAGDLKK